MNIEELRSILQDCGVAGAGGAGFPTYAKLSTDADTILMNCAECEPLLKLHRQLLSLHTKEILQAFALIAETVGAKEAIIGIKKEYTATIEAINEYIDAFPGMRIHTLTRAYPMGDEVVLIYEATKKQVPPGGLPIQCGVAVFNVETLYNVYRAVFEKQPVTDKLVSVVGEVKTPVTLRVPLGMTIAETVQLAGGATVKDPVYLLGGPMMGSFGAASQPVKKTTNAVIVLQKDHPLVLKKKSKFSIDVARAASICCQCETCTDLCPRRNLGHPIQPHLFMRAAANRDFQNMDPFLDTFFCSSCGLCELYSCPQGLKPRSMIAEYKNGLRAAGVKPPKREAKPVKEAREYRKAPEGRLLGRLGLDRYDVAAPLIDAVRPAKRVKVLMSQHIGAPAVACVKAGEAVSAGQPIAAAAEGLSISLHAPISGTVTSVTATEIVIEQ